MLDDLLRQFELTEYASQIKSIAKHCIEGIPSEGIPEIGGSKVGGLPDVDPEFRWPIFKDVPLEFIAQINCANLHSEVLPNTGLLQFFYDNRHCGGSLKDRGFILVHYIEKLGNISTAQHPSVEKKRCFGLLSNKILPRTYRESKISFQKAISLPDLDELPKQLRELFDDGDVLSDAYCDLKGTLSEQRFIQVVGYPNPVQYDGIADRISRLFGKGSSEDWEMIFEISDSKCTDMMWGDAGRLHFFVYKEDIKNRNFSDAWMEFQCG